MNFYCIQPQRHEFTLLLKGITAYCFKYQGNYHLGQMYTFSDLFKLRLSLKAANIFLLLYFWRLNEVYQAMGFYSLYSIHLPQPTALRLLLILLGFPLFSSFLPFPSLSFSLFAFSADFPHKDVPCQCVIQVQTAASAATSFIINLNNLTGRGKPVFQ